MHKVGWASHQSGRSGSHPNRDEPSPDLRYQSRSKAHRGRGPIEVKDQSRSKVHRGRGPIRGWSLPQIMPYFGARSLGMGSSRPFRKTHETHVTQNVAPFRTNRKRAEFAPNTLLGGMNEWDDIRILMNRSSHLLRNRLL